MTPEQQIETIKTHWLEEVTQLGIARERLRGCSSGETRMKCIGEIAVRLHRSDQLLDAVCEIRDGTFSG